MKSEIINNFLKIEKSFKKDEISDSEINLLLPSLFEIMMSSQEFTYKSNNLGFFKSLSLKEFLLMKNNLNPNLKLAVNYNLQRTSVFLWNYENIELKNSISDYFEFDFIKKTQTLERNSGKIISFEYSSYKKKDKRFQKKKLEKVFINLIDLENKCQNT